MAFNFPDTPTVGQTYSGYVWDGEKWLIQSANVSEAPLGNLVYGRANNAGAGEWRRAVEVAGDTMTGLLVFNTIPTISGAPPAAGDNSTKVATTAYVDTAAGLRVLKAGDTITGTMTHTVGSVLLTSTLGYIGHATGAGTSVTQTSSRTTSVVANRPCGQITLVSAAGSATYQSFTVSSSQITANDVVILNQKSGTDLYETHITNVAAGSFRITFRTTGGTTTEQPVFTFVTLRGSPS